MVGVSSSVKVSIVVSICACGVTLSSSGVTSVSVDSQEKNSRLKIISVISFFMVLPQEY